MRKNFLKLAVIFLKIFVSSFALADTVKIDAGYAGVFYYGFEIQRITGILEQEIEEYGCEYSIDSKDFSEFLSKGKETSAHYDERDVRAKIKLSNNSEYYIDRFGVIRHGNQVLKIDKAIFLKLLVPVNTTRCSSQNSSRRSD